VRTYFPPAMRERVYIVQGVPQHSEALRRRDFVGSRNTRNRISIGATIFPRALRLHDNTHVAPSSHTRDTLSSAISSPTFGWLTERPSLRRPRRFLMRPNEVLRAETPLFSQLSLGTRDHHPHLKGKTEGINIPGPSCEPNCVRNLPR